MEGLLKEYSFSITDQSYTVGEASDSTDSTDGEAEVKVAAAYARAKTVVPDKQGIELTNRLSGTKTVYWHKLWDDSYVYSEGNRPDIYLDIFQLVHKEDEHGNLKQYVEPYIRDYRWDYSADTEVTETVIDNGNLKTHWHVVLDNLPKYDEETGREYYYYAVERAKVNIKQFDYADVTYYVTNDNSTPDVDASNEDWAGTSTEDLSRIGTARSSIQEEYLTYGFNDPAEAYEVPEDLKPEVPLYKYYKYPSYMLLEGGYFSNTLSQDVTIVGRKLWQALPNSYPAVDLPAVKFSVYQSLETESTNGVETPAAEASTTPNGTFVATKTVSNWADANHDGTYQFEIDHRTNEKGEPVDEEGNTVDSEEDAAKLPQYDKNGRRYVYTLVEDSIIWADDNETKISDESDSRAGIFDTTQPGEKNFVATNDYNGVKGSLAVKKILKLEQKTSSDGTTQYVYPAVKFRLERYYQKYENGQPSGDPVKDDSFKQEKIWTSQEVKAAHEANADSDSVTGTITFSNLEKYAPNGSEYQYTVTEDTAFLGGYNTWAAKGDKDANDVRSEDNKDKSAVQNLIVTPDSPNTELTPAATFLNEYPETEREKYPLVVQKVWKDYDDAFGLRPDKITVELYRYADAQPGQSNSISEKFATVTLPTKMDDTDTFKITFATGISGYEAADIQCELKETTSGSKSDYKWTLESFERYSPNGMPWKYFIKERDLGQDTPYQSNPGEAWGWWNTTDGRIQNHPISALINSIYTDAPFKKEWKDKDGNPITQDYLSYDLTVTFALQVKEGDDGQWTDASSYFTDNLSDDALDEVKTACDSDTFKKTITGKVNAEVWSGSFTNLPTVIVKKDTTSAVKLSYRVVEQEVKCGNPTKEQTITLNNDETSYTVSPTGLVTEAAFNTSGSVTTNTLDVTSLTVRKIWSGDSFNQYKTRPTTKKPDCTWETTFVIQRSTDANPSSWEKVTEVTLSGTDGDSTASATIAGLPTNDLSGNSYTYRARELEPDTTDAVEQGGSYHNGAYTVTYSEDTTAGTIIATNKLKPGGGDSKTYTTYAAEKNWDPTGAPADEDSRTSTFALQYLAKDARTWTTLAEVTLDGTKDTNLASGNETDGADQMVYGEDNPWHAVWRDVPLKHPNSYVANESEGTLYRVVETGYTPADYITQSDPSPVLDGKTCTFKFRNIQPTTLTVEKKWVTVNDSDKKAVVAGLYRTTVPDDIGKADESLAVKDTDKPQMTLTLTADTNWTGKFDKLPAYDTNGKQYYYYALEQSVGGNPVAGSGFSAVYDHTTTPGKTTITNVPTTSITGTKIWLDNHDAYHTRPDSLILTLERSEGGTGPWKEVADATPEWTKKDDEWIYSYEDLPAVSSNSLTYQYRVTETMPSGYVQGNTTDANSFVNILTGTTNFTVTKQWTYNGTDPLPKLHLTLYRSTQGVNANDKEAVDTVTPTVNKNSRDTWVYNYTGLPEYNANGIRYTYWVEETVPDGYDAKNGTAKDGGTLENVQQGSLKVSKAVSGNQGETDREFDFKITLSGTSTANIQAEEVDGTYGGVLFQNGVAEFPLKHGESKTITDLPAGLNYTVEEIEANQDGYTTTIRMADGRIVSDVPATGTIPPGTQAEVTFQNDRHHSSSTTTTVQGTKTWVDNSDAAGLRPDDLELILYRSVSGGKEEKVDAQPTWNKSDGNVWTYCYSDLPAHSGGMTYVYQVEEIVPDGYTVRYNGNDMVNTLDTSGMSDRAPATNDPTPLGLWILLCLASLGAALALIARKRHK